jgi:hypothetical protein
MHILGGQLSLPTLCTLPFNLASPCVTKNTLFEIGRSLGCNLNKKQKKGNIQNVEKTVPEKPSFFFETGTPDTL